MSVACPLCSGEIEEDFGLVDCPHCGKPVMISVDGTVQTQDDSSNSSVEEPVIETHFEESSEESIDVYEEPVTEFEAIAESEEAEAESVPDVFADEFVEEEPPELLPEEEVIAEVTSPDISSLVSDQDEASLLTGPYAYTVYIEGVDTADIRRDLKDSLADHRLRMDVDAIIETMDQGQLKIENLSSVKAAIVVQRLRLLPIEIRWTQERVK